MRHLLGMLLLFGPIGILFFVVYRVTRGVEDWFLYNPAASNTIMWAVVAAVVVAVLGIGIGIGAGASMGGIGLGRRAYVMRLRHDQYLESVPHALAAPARERAALPAPSDEMMLPEPVKQSVPIRVR